jgi:uncharacterized cupin superfamily protein
MKIQLITDISAKFINADFFRPLAERILHGSPDQKIDNRFSSACGRFNAGIWQGEIGTWEVYFTEYEYCEILAGVSTIVDCEGVTRTVRAGDRFVIPAGFKGTWEVVQSCRKIYVSYE